LFKERLTGVAEISLSGEEGVGQCFSTFLLQRNLAQLFALLVEPYATVKQWYCYIRTELWLRISYQAGTEFMGGRGGHVPPNFWTVGT